MKFREKRQSKRIIRHISFVILVSGQWSVVSR
jgi:hypothetical protein